MPPPTPSTAPARWGVGGCPGVVGILDLFFAIFVLDHLFDVLLDPKCLQKAKNRCQTIQGNDCQEHLVFDA